MSDPSGGGSAPTGWDTFPPRRAAALERLAAVQPEAYARTRNHLEGAVTRLSPYLTHGLLGLAEVAAALDRRHALPVQHKLVFELAWRAWFHHAWHHAGEGILDSLHEGPLPDSAYARAMPDDVRTARSGVPAVDQAVRTLYAVGWLHNHARLWLASYLVHLRKVHWRAGADWMYTHLLDGDLASNHLSWQWVAGTGSAKPYLFNADNVARFAPPAWHSPGTAIDAPYEVLDRVARTPGQVLCEPPRQRDPSLAASGTATSPPDTFHAPPPALAPGFTEPDARRVAGRDVWLVHPWALHDPQGESGGPAPGAVRLGVFLGDFHARWAWSERRWRFVAGGLQGQVEETWWCSSAELAAALKGARSVRGVADPHLAPYLGPGLRGGLGGDPPAGIDAPQVAWVSPPRLFPTPARRCGSFTQYWREVSGGVTTLRELLAG